MKNNPSSQYTAKDIHVLEGLEPVRMRPGMYIGGTDEKAMHHLVSEILDNAVDEAVAGFAKDIWIELQVGNKIIIRDNGRGIPVDNHPKYPDKSALEIILTTLHSGGKFTNDVYKTSGGLHGVGISVVNALSENMTVSVSKDGFIYRQSFSKGIVKSPLEKIGKTENSSDSGTCVEFVPDPTIFGKNTFFKPLKIYRSARAKAFLFKGIKIHFSCDPSLITDDLGIKNNETFCFPNGLTEFLQEAVKNKDKVCKTKPIFEGEADLADDKGKIEWAVTWINPETYERSGFMSSYCNTIPTPEGGTHESGFRAGITRSLKQFAEMIGNKKAAQITAEDVFGEAGVLIYIFYKNPEFQGQTKEKFSSSDAVRLVDNAVKDYFDHWLISDKNNGIALLDFVVEKSDERLRSRKAKETVRKSATKKLRLPGKLADCTSKDRTGTELFIVEGDSAGGSAKQARNRETQAVLPLRGKILNVASASIDKMNDNKEIQDIKEAIGCNSSREYNEENLRYDKIIIMTDADVDGAHIASLLMTFFYRQLPQLVRDGKLYLAMPPLFKISGKGKTFYAFSDEEKELIIEKNFKGLKPDVSRFKGLGEMNPDQLKNTTMDPKKRMILQVKVPSNAEEELEDAEFTSNLVERLMGKNAEQRFLFIQEHAKFATNLDI